MSSLPLPALPRCVVLRSNHDNRYLRSVVSADGDENRGGVELSGDGGVMDPRSRFYLEPSKEHDGLLHVRCCYNNKYWVAQQREELHGSGARWIIATTDEPEENLSKPSCTLFKNIPVDGGEGGEGPSICRFLHPHLDKYVGVVSTVTSDDKSTTTHPYLHIPAHDDEEADQDKYLIEAFTATDVTEQKQLPLFVVFKGFNEYFLGGQVINRNNFLQFSKVSMEDPTALQIVSTNNDGVVRIKSNFFDLFWRRSPNWIWADSSDTTHLNPDTRFKVITRDDFILLQNLGNFHFCKRLTAERNTSCLNAAAPTVDDVEARLQVYEPVRSREIFDVEFRPNDARTYETAIQGLYDQTVRNETSTTARSTLSFTYTNTVSSTWSSTVSMKVAIKVTLQSKIKFFVKGEIVASSEFSGSYTWGKSETQQQQVTRKIDVDVPPMKKITVKATATNGVCEVPFSYKQKDVLTNGHEVIQEFTDGMYFGIKTSSMTFHAIEEDL